MYHFCYSRHHQGEGADARLDDLVPLLVEFHRIDLKSSTDVDFHRLRQLTGVRDHLDAKAGCCHRFSGDVRPLLAEGGDLLGERLLESHQRLFDEGEGFELARRWLVLQSLAQSDY